MRNIFLFICIFFILPTSNLLSEDIYKSPHFLGRASTGMADSSAPKLDSIFLNPATLKHAKKGVNLVSLTASASENTIDQTQDFLNLEDTEDPKSFILSHVGELHHVHVSNLSGVSTDYVSLAVLANFETNFGVLKKLEYAGMESATINGFSNILAVASGYHEIIPGLTIGTNVKKVFRSYQLDKTIGILDADELKNIDKDLVLNPIEGNFADFGLLLSNKPEEGSYKPFHSLGISYTNLVATGVKYRNTGKKVDKDEYPDMYKPSLNIGYAFEFDTKITKFKILLDWMDVLSEVEKEIEKKLRLGVDLNLFDILGITAGLYQGYASYGVYADLDILKFDISMYREELSPYVGIYAENRYAARLSIGF